MRTVTVALTIVACLVFGCRKPTPSHVEIKISGDGQYTLDNTPCDANSLRDELNVKRQRSVGRCSLRVICDPGITASAFFRVMNQATESGIWDISLQVEGTPESVDCSRPTPEQLPESEPQLDETKQEEIVSIMVTAEALSINGTKCNPSDLGDLLKNKVDAVIVTARPNASVGKVHAVLLACKSKSLRAWLFAAE